MKKTILLMISIVFTMCSCTLQNTTDEAVCQESIPLSNENINNEPLEPDEIEVEPITIELEEPHSAPPVEELPTLYTLDVNATVSQVEEINNSDKTTEEAKVEIKKEEPPINNVVSISISAVDDIILEPSLVELQDDQTVFDILNKTTKDNKIHMDYSGRGGTIYIKGINNIYEHDMGAESGWMYSVNGEFPNTSCGSYVLQPGDVIEWRYTLNLGRDLGSSFD